MKYETWDTGGTASTLLSTTYYYYNDVGNVTRVVTNAAGSDVYNATLFGYAKNQATVSFVVGETWSSTTYAVSYAREFRYDGARQRYLNRELDPVALQSRGTLVAVQDTWTDYDGGDAYGDFLVDYDTGAAHNTRSYEPGMATFGWYDDGISELPVPDASTVAYLGTDLIGTTRHMTDVNNAVIDPVVYTAFGERIDGTNHRYGYAGAWGYQSHSFGEVGPPLDPDTVFPYLHVGARYYDPATGRFLQRDPIGVRGGLNLYLYAGANPLIFVDPDGLDFWGSVGGAFLDVTGGRGTTFLDRWGNRMRGRTVPGGAASGAGTAANARRRKGIPGPGARRTTHRWARSLRNRGFRRSARFARRAGPIAMACGGLVDVYILAKEGIYGYYNVPPGMY